MKHLKRAIFGAAASLAVIAAAWFAATIISESTSPPATMAPDGGAVEMPLTLTVADGLAPGGQVGAAEVTAVVNNPLSRPVPWHNLKLTPTNLAPGCEAAWLTFAGIRADETEDAVTGGMLRGENTTRPGSIPPGESNLGDDLGVAPQTFWVRFKTGTLYNELDQSACQGSTFTVHGKIES